MSYQEEIQLDVALVVPMLLANQCQTVYLRIGLTGFDLQTITEPLVPVNLALVVDTSSSMRGEKMDHAKELAMKVVKRLRPTDLVTLITLNEQGNVLLPIAKVRNQAMLYEMIQTLGDNEQATLFDSTALFDGIEKGAGELLKHRLPYQINRILLLSDGFANVGPHSPTDMGELGRILSEEKIAVTTVGFGTDYHQKLMMLLSQPSDGNHAVVEKTGDIIGFVEREFSEMALMVAQEIKLVLICNEKVRPIKVLGSKAEIEESIVLVPFNQLYSGLEKYILVELEIPSTSNQQQSLANLIITYYNLQTYCYQRLEQEMTVDKLLIINC